MSWTNSILIDNDMKRIHDLIIQIKIFTSKFLFQIMTRLNALKFNAFLFQKNIFQ